MFRPDLSPSENHALSEHSAHSAQQLRAKFEAGTACLPPSRTVRVTVPAEAGPGTVLQVPQDDIPGGSMYVQVPAGVAPGGSFAAVLKPPTPLPAFRWY
jgi:hypothetical protein